LNSEAGSEHWREIVYLSITHTNNNNNKKDTNNNKNSLRVKGSYIHTYEKCVEENPIPTLIYPKSWHQMVAGRQAAIQ
jgi:hypothetical protein